MNVIPPGREQLSGWGRRPIVEGVERRSEDLTLVTRDAALSRGAGRSYGDASLPPGPGRIAAGTRLADRVLGFDEETGVVHVEAGCTLGRLHRLFLPRGWCVPAIPGTEHVTAGGMVAADVHGKDHHRSGCFGAHVDRLTIRVADGRVLEISEQHEPDLFHATLGGMGLTGHILTVAFRMEAIPSGWIRRETEPVASLAGLLDTLRAASAEWPFTVAWVDALAPGARRGRGLVVKGRWAEAAEAPQALPRARRRASVPRGMPGWLTNRWSGRLANALYYRARSPAADTRFVTPWSHFHPLDVVQDWNRLYGRRGFIQHHCVLPDAGDVARYLATFARHDAAPMLAVIKDLGGEGRGLLSFPKPGVSVAVDVPWRAGRTQSLVDALNELVIEGGGRVYLAKDALTRPEHYRAMEPRLDRWLAVRRRWDPETRLATALSVRLFGDSP